MTNIKSEEVEPAAYPPVRNSPDARPASVPSVRLAPDQAPSPALADEGPAVRYLEKLAELADASASSVRVIDAEDIKRAARMRARATDPVKEPAHYKSEGGLEVIDVIEAFGLEKDAYLFNVVKYILRSEKKGAPIEDLKKARQYLSRKIAALEGRRGWE